METPNVMIGAPIARNRAWIIQEYLSGIHSLDYPKDKIHIAFLINGKERDNTEEYIFEFKTKFESEYNQIDIWSMNDEYADERNGNRDYTHFSNIRNTWVSMRRKEDEYLFSVDSDILLEPDTLKGLLSHDKEIISALIKNGNVGSYDIYNIMDFSLFSQAKNEFICIYDHLIKGEGLSCVDVTGACYLIHRDVFNKGAHYGKHIQGEDVYFCEKAKKLGYNIYCDQDITPRHIMSKEEHGKSLIRI